MTNVIAPLNTVCPTGFKALDEMLGGGFVPHCSILLAGPNGSGKTALAAQAADGFTKNGMKVYYMTGNCSRHAVDAHFKRIGVDSRKVFVRAEPKGLVFDEATLDDVVKTDAKLLIVDNMQTCTVENIVSDFGAKETLFAVVSLLTRFAQKHGIALLLLYPIDKEKRWSHAPKTMTHLVDGILCLEPIKNSKSRRRLFWNGKSRQSDATIERTIELLENCRFQ